MDNLNMRDLAPSRKRVRPGDVFALRVRGRGYFFGRVVAKDVHWAFSSDARALLLNIYDHESPELVAPPDRVLESSQLLVPPFLSGSGPWTQGKFQTLENRPLPQNLESQHYCFYNRTLRRYYDSRGHEIAGPVGITVFRSMPSLAWIDDQVSQALGLELFSDEP